MIVRAPSVRYGAVIGLAISALFASLSSAPSLASTPSKAPLISLQIQDPSPEVNQFDVATICVLGKLPSPATVRLQKALGVKQPWRNLVTLATKEGECLAIFAGQKTPGRTLYRAQLWHAERLEAQTSVHAISAYTHVSFGTLCYERWIDRLDFPAVECRTRPQRGHVGTTIMTYHYSDRPPLSPRYDEVVTAPSTTCDLLHVEAGILTARPRKGGPATVELVRSDGAPSAVTLPVDRVVSVDFRLGNAPWYLEDWQNTGSHTDTIVLNGWVNCWTSRGTS